MILLASIFVLSFVGLIGCGLFVHMYLYSRGAFTKGKVNSTRGRRLGAASFSQTATMPMLEDAAELYYGGIGTRNDGMFSYSRQLLLYSLAIVLILIVLAVLVMGATQF